MLLYTETITPRLRYILNFVAQQILPAAIEVTNNAVAFIQSADFKISYCMQPLTEKAFHIKPVNLLFEDDIKQQPIKCFITANNKKAFFETAGDIEFDILAACFYLLTRYEEYLPHEKDMYGRYAHTNSLAFKENFLNQPLVNCWLEDFKKQLQQKFPALVFKHQQFKFIPTYDIDIAFSIRHKSFVRTAGALLRDFFNGDWKKLEYRIAVLRQRQPDPFDTYEWLDALHLYCKLRPYYFFLLAEKQQGYDRNIHPSKKALQQLITYQSTKGTVGIHPSWQSSDDKKALKNEIGWLEFLIDAEVKYSRQHYIRFTIPHTFRKLIAAGIKNDFSMGYGSINGFRASVASSFFWYDLEKNEATTLRMFPFCFMDANALYEEKLTPAHAFNQLMHFYNQVKAVNGLMITLWHNNFFGTHPQFNGWKEVYDVFVKDEVYWDALM
jgi:hypothetical protein